MTTVFHVSFILLKFLLVLHILHSRYYPVFKADTPHNDVTCPAFKLYVCVCLKNEALIP